MPPVVFIHGLIGSLRVPDMTAFFAPGKALAPDLLGYGELSATPPAQITMAAQVEHLSETLRRHFGDQPVHLVGHSVGGVVAALFAERHGERVASLVSVEGNFTLRDAFWSSSVARMSAAQANALLDGLRDDPATWLAGAGVAASSWSLAVAERWLAQQPGSTVRAMAQAVVSETGAADYLPRLRRIFARHPVHLLAGERSREGWDVPPWAQEEAASQQLLAGCGHLMMLEDCQAFVGAISSALCAPLVLNPATTASTP
ncbi:alpha/beta fold hydrolase [Pseudomonas borbori]